MERVFPRNQLHPSHIGEGVVRVDAFFSSFFRAERKDNMGFGGIPHSMKWKREIGGKGWRFVKKLAKNLVVS